MKTITSKEKDHYRGVSATLCKVNGARNGSLSKVVRAPVHSPLRLKSILVPIDFSQPSQNALEYALPLLKQFGAKLTLMHVVEPLPVPAFMTSFPPSTEKDKDIAGARGHLENLIKQNALDPKRVETLVCRGRSFDEIANMARRLKTDLIIMSTHGYTGLKHVLLGSTAERVVRHAPCPVLVVRKKPPFRAGQSGSRLKLQRILVPLDFSDCSLKGLKYSTAFARKFHASQTLLHAVHPAYYFSSSDFDMIDYGNLVEDSERAAVRQMNALLKDRSFADLKVSGQVHIAHPITEIIDTAKREKSDLIVLSTHGHTGLDHVLLGSTAENVIRLASCPVLVVRDLEHEFV
jgi:nucleotide-binding universal stress UspA family protein